MKQSICALAAFVALAAAGSTAWAQNTIDPSLQVQGWVKGLDHPTGLGFVDDGATALVIEKNTGKVKIVKNKQVVGVALDLPVANASEQGLLSIAVAPDFATSKFVYLDYIASTEDGGLAYDNRVERYKWNGSTLVYDRGIVRAPVGAGPNLRQHVSGKITFGKDGKLYMTVGDTLRTDRTQNINDGVTLRTGCILRMNPSGTSVINNPFYSAANIGTPNNALNDIFAYGIRNSFGIASDPITGDLWDTENGALHYDEINHVTRGFDGGWKNIIGPESRNGPHNVIKLGPAAHYEDPELSWEETVAPTDAFFMDSNRLGSQYKNDLFVGTYRTGSILHFKLNDARDSLVLSGGLVDGVADNTLENRNLEQGSVRWGYSFGIISDLASGPGGMYVLSYDRGTLYRITTATSSPSAVPGLADSVRAVPEPGAPSLIIFALALAGRRRRCRDSQGAKSPCHGGSLLGHTR